MLLSVYVNKGQMLLLKNSRKIFFREVFPQISFINLYYNECYCNRNNIKQQTGSLICSNNKIHSLILHQVSILYNACLSSRFANKTSFTHYQTLQDHYFSAAYGGTLNIHLSTVLWFPVLPALWHELMHQALPHLIFKQ